MCIAIAGIISQNKLTTVNAAWPPIDISILKSQYKFKIEFINDLESSGYGVHLSKGLNLNPLSVEDPNGNLAVLGCGTGLGEAIITEKHGKKIVIATEGGYKDFAPRDEQQFMLLKSIQASNKSVSVPVERVCSGRGIQNILSFIAKSKTDLSPKDIVMNGLKNESKECTESIKLFAKILGAEASNLCISSLATKGVYIFGGAVQDMKEYLQKEESGFLQAFYQREVLTDFMKKVPLYFTTEESNLLGAEYYSLHMD